MQGIERRTAICGGTACIADTQIPVWVLAADLVHAWAYVHAYRQETDEAIRRDEAA
jgi:uncharacterized protein (DUF433 family)